MMGKDNFDVKNAIIAGSIAGIVSGFVKLGWENLFPPRTPDRDATNPPQQFLQQLGVPSKLTHATYTYSEHKLPWVSFLLHFGFSTSFGAFYTVAGHYLPLLKIGQGTFFWCRRLGSRTSSCFATIRDSTSSQRSASRRTFV